MEIKKFFYVKFHLIDGLGMEFSLLNRADARGSTDIIYRIWRISLLCRSGIVIEVKK